MRNALLPRQIILSVPKSERTGYSVMPLDYLIGSVISS